MEKPTHIIFNGEQQTTLKWSAKSQKILFSRGNWTGGIYSKEKLESGEYGYTLKPIYMPMENK